MRIAFIQLGHLLLRVTRDATLPPHYIESRIAPVHAPDDFRAVQTAFVALEMDQAVPPAPDYMEFGTFPGLAKSLRHALPRLNEAFSEANYPAIKSRMDKVEQEGWRRWNQKQSGRGR
jgi:hypothetical protein